ncbi:hypothetical protein KL920_001979 [Ogataea angusta]|nr:hypothetical protein KL920_001979 [Ogataea angusta]
MLDVEEEFESLKAIYPEIELDSSAKSGRLVIPVVLDKELEICLENSAQAQLISNLSPIELCFTLRDKYPQEEPPHVELRGAQWIVPSNKDAIVASLIGLWQDYREVVLFSIIDYLKERSRDAFGVIDFSQPLVLDKKTYEQYLEADLQAKRNQFNLSTFMCEICQNDKKGLAVQRFDPCGHIYCNECLREYFTSNILRGELDNIHCPSFDCTKAYVETNDRLSRGLVDQDMKQFEKEFFEVPLTKEFLNRIVDPELTERYWKLNTTYKFEKYRRLFPFRVAQCPRRHCAKYFLRKDENDLLSICPDCKMAFCFGCLHSWHGDLNSCRNYLGEKIPLEDIQLWLEHDPDSQVRNNLAFKYGRKAIVFAVEEHLSDMMFEELIESGEAGIVRCPSCSLLIQRSDGCNKMTCSRCRTYFCNLCGETLSRTDPYSHYNNPMNECFRRLFDGLVQES